MRFIVELYRGIILLGLALMIVGGAFVFFMMRFGGYTATSELTVPLLFSGATLTIIALGLVATFISIHDRIAEIARSTERAVDLLARNAAQEAEPNS